MERRSLESAVAEAATWSEGGTLSGGAVASFFTLPSHAERTLAERLARELAEGPHDARLRAASRLVDVAGGLAVPLLAHAIADADGALRLALADALGRAGGAEALAAIDDLRDDPDPQVRAAAVDAAARLLGDDPQALAGALREALADPDPRVRRRAALQAASARGIDAGELLAPVLGDEDRQARRLAAVALSTTRSPNAALALVDALLDDDDSVREAATASASLLFGEEAARIASLSPLQRGRAVARLRAHVAANAGRLGAEEPRARRLPEAEVAPTADERAAGRAGSGSDYLEAFEAAAFEEDAVEPFSPIDEEPAARADHELDEDVLAVMEALSLARSFALERHGRKEAPPFLVEEPPAALETELEETAESRAEAHPGEHAVAVAGADEGHDAAGGAESAQAGAAAPADGEDDVAAHAPVEYDVAAVAVDEPADLAALADDMPADFAALEDDVRAAVDEAPASREDVGPTLLAIEEVIRAALRGVTPDDLAAELGVPVLALGPVLDEHLDAGRIVRRGKKLFLP